MDDYENSEMLGPQDDFLIHQTPDVIARPATSDPNFYDRYYFCLYSTHGGLIDPTAPVSSPVMVMGMGHYPNRGVADAFSLLAVDDKQVVVRSSRELGPNRLDPSVGPISIQVIEGLHSFALKCEPNEWGLSYDLVWTSAAPPLLEQAFFARAPYGRVLSHTRRIHQTGWLEGEIRLGDRRFEVTQDTWCGGRDHSWGIRSPLGEKDNIGAKRGEVPSFMGGVDFVMWLPTCRLKNTTLYLGYLENNGAVVEEFCRAVPHYGIGGGAVNYRVVHVEFDYVLDHSRYDRAQIVLSDRSGNLLTLELEPIAWCAQDVGTGYGPSMNPGGVDEDDWAHGVYQGPLVVQGKAYQLADVVKQDPTTTVCRIRIDGEIVGICNCDGKADPSMGAIMPSKMRRGERVLRVTSRAVR